MDPNRPPQDQDGPNRPSDRNTSDRDAPDRPSPDRPPPERLAPEQNASERTASDRPAPERSSLDRPAPERSERPVRSTPVRSAPDRIRRDSSDQGVHRPTYGVPKTLAPLQPPQGPSGGLVAFEQSSGQSWTKCIYNRETGEYFYRTPKSWFLILSYSAMYLIFLMTFTLIVLYISLVIIKQTIDFDVVTGLKAPLYELLTYPGHGIGLTATPTSEDNVPLIWYKNGERDDYNKYVKAIDKFLLSNRRKREVSSLGPCGQSPYGYGERPCIIVRINKQFHWAGKPLNINSTIVKSAPAEVQAWMKADTTKLWLQCNGYHSYDKEHIGRIKYYPDPPGFDASMFPLDANKQSPLVAVQISEFTIGISLAVECKLWYDTGPSTFEFMLYVDPGDKIAYKGVNV